MKIRNLKIRNKLVILLTVPIMVLLLVALITVISMNVVTANKEEIFSSSSLVLNGDRDMYQALIAAHNLVTYDKSSEAYQQALESWQENTEQVKQRMTAVKALSAKLKALQSYRHSETKQTVEEASRQFDETFARWLDLTQSLIDRQSDSDIAEARLLLQQLDESFDTARSNLNIAGEIIDEYTQKRIKEDNKLKQSTRFYTILAVAIAILLVIGLGALLIKSITSPIYKLQGLMGRAEKGDLTLQGEYDSKDEIGQLSGSFNAMLTGFKTTLAKVLYAAESVSASSQEISASTEEIASGSNDQASSAQRMSELFGDLSAAINSVAHSAGLASDLANRTMDIAKEGGAVVDASISSMDLLNEQMVRLENDSNKIGEIIEVIDDIAEQTNLLALNAAIEAARAGDQGRGFAVVADEVRKLAERSGEATKQITAIIKGMQANTQQSVRAVGEGVAMSQKTGEAFDNIAAMVNESGLKVSEIAAASQSQSAQTTEVLQAIETISAATEESAASSEETAAAAQSLAQLAEELNMTVSVFKIQ